MMKKGDTMDVSLKSSKAEILEAYENLKAKVEEFSSRSPADKRVEELIKSEEKKIVERAAGYTVERIIKDFAELNLHVGKALTELSERLTQESNKLQEMEKAAQIETRRLEELRDIRVAADTLVLLMQEYEERKESLELEAAQRRDDWKKEQALHDALVKEKDASLAKDRQREKEEYEYSLALARKKDKDVYEQQKAALSRALMEEREKQQKELADREAAMTAREAELNDLRQKAQSFQATLETAVGEAVEKAQAAERGKAETAARLAAKETEGEKKVLELKFLNLQEIVTKQAVQIESLTRQLTEANNQVQAIAVKAIEGASGAKTLSTVQEIALEQAKQAKTQK